MCELLAEMFDLFADVCERMGNILVLEGVVDVGGMGFGDFEELDECR